MPGMPGKPLRVASLLPHVKLIMITGLLLQPVCLLKMLEMVSKEGVMAGWKMMQPSQ